MMSPSFCMLIILLPIARAQFANGLFMPTAPRNPEVESRMLAILRQNLAARTANAPTAASPGNSWPMLNNGLTGDDLQFLYLMTSSPAAAMSQQPIIPVNSPLYQIYMRNLQMGSINPYLGFQPEFNAWMRFPPYYMNFMGLNK